VTPTMFATASCTNRTPWRADTGLSPLGWCGGYPLASGGDVGGDGITSGDQMETLPATR